MSRASERQYEDFHGEEPDEDLDLDLVDPEGDLEELGVVTSISYRAMKDGEGVTFTHEFRRGTGPYLAKDAAEPPVPFLLGGSYQVTDRGIQDGGKRWKDEWVRPPEDGTWILGELAGLSYLAPDETDPIHIEWDEDDGPPLAVRPSGELLLGAAFDLPDDDEEDQ